MDVRKTEDGFEYAVEHDYMGEEFFERINNAPDYTLEEITAMLEKLKDKQTGEMRLTSVYVTSKGKKREHIDGD